MLTFLMPVQAKKFVFVSFFLLEQFYCNNVIAVVTMHIYLPVTTQSQTLIIGRSGHISLS